jgi:carbonic anhydrase/acetyltransferase-like protein (isoleucine patch superfamily)
MARLFVGTDHYTHIEFQEFRALSFCIIGCSIGQNCVVAANSAVTRNVPDRCVVAGAPGRAVRRFCPETRLRPPTGAAGEYLAVAEAGGGRPVS